MSEEEATAVFVFFSLCLCLYLLIIKYLLVGDLKVTVQPVKKTPQLSSYLYFSLYFSLSLSLSLSFDNEIFAGGVILE